MSDLSPQHQAVTAHPTSDSADANQMAPNRSHSRRNATYVFFWIGVGLLLSLATLQTYVQHGGRHLWEPFLWEMSSVFAVALLMPLIYRWINFADTANWNKLKIGAVHIAVACGFSIAHVSLMLTIRFFVYFLMDTPYQPGRWWSVLSYEAPKDFVTYALLAGICYGMVLMQREQRHKLEVSRIEAELSRARLARLQDQLQPHFLFNTLNLVSSLMGEDVERADKVLERLGDLLRSTLSLSNQTQHTLREELHILEPYLDIMAARFGERVQVQIDCDDAARGCMVPCLLLLPLIENAVHHGVEKCSLPANIKVSGDVAHGELRVGISADVGDLERDTREGGIGLANTRARLNQMYANRAVITLNRLKPQGVEVLIKLPASTLL